MDRKNLSLRLFAFVLVSGLASAAIAIPYASGVRNTTGNTFEFILNESAEDVTVLRDGANPVLLGTLAPGRHTFDMSGFSSWEIKVAQNTPVAAWSAVNFPDNPFDDNRFYAHFEQPTGIAVNTNSASPYFGTVYVNNSRTGTTGSGRSNGDGVYALTADMIGVNLTAGANYFTVPDYNDTSFAKAPSPWVVGSPGDTTGASGWRMTLDAGGNIILGDWSDGNGGIKYAAPDLNSGGLVLAQQSGPTGGVIGVNGKPVHGSISSAPYVTGTVGVDLKVWAMDEDLHQTRNPNPGTNANGNHIWMWNVGSVTGGYNIEPELALNTATLPKTTDNRLNYVSINNGIATDAYYSPQSKKWYLSINRFDGNDSGLAVVTIRPGDYNGNGTIDTGDYVAWRKTNINGAQGYADWKANFGLPTVKMEWSSLQFSIDNNLDGNPGLASIQDIFRGMGGESTVSPDGKFLYVRQVDMRSTGPRSTNPFFGTGGPTDLRGEVIVIPLDANGVPDIHVSGGALTNVTTLEIDANPASSSRRPIAVDVVGNVYVGDNISERLNVFSPGGATLATTRSDGTFSLGTPALAHAQLFAEVPEPSALALAAVGMVLVSARRVRGKR